MRLTLQRLVEPVPYLGALVRVGGVAGEPGRCGALVAAGEEGDEARVLALLLGLLLVLGEPPQGMPLRQHWVQAGLRVVGRMDSELAPRQAAAARRMGARVEAEWPRFVRNGLARLRGEARGDAHFRFSEGGWTEERPRVLVTAWPPLQGVPLPVLR